MSRLPFLSSSCLLQPFLFNSFLSFKDRDEGLRRHSMNKAKSGKRRNSADFPHPPLRWRSYKQARFLERQTIDSMSQKGSTRAQSHRLKSSDPISKQGLRRGEKQGKDRQKPRVPTSWCQHRLDSFSAVRARA